MQFTLFNSVYDLPNRLAPLFKSRFFYDAFLVLTIVLTTSSFYYYFASGVVNADGLKGSATDNKLYLLLWLILYGGAGLSFLSVSYKRGVYTSFFIITPFILWVLFSFSWSVAGGRTLYFGIMLVMQVFIAYSIASNIHPERVVRILIYTFTVLLVLSIAGFIIMPEKTSLARYGGGWLVDTEMNGVFSHKSDAGYFFACLIILLLSAKQEIINWSKTVRFGFIALAFVGIILANSATALASALILGGVYFLLPFMSDHKKILYRIGIGCIVFAIAVPYINIGQFASLIGRDAGLTGRGLIWQQGVQFISDAPLIGYGYYGFFDQNIFSPVWDLWAKFNYFLTPHFHNSGLDIVISLGLIGLGFYVFLLSRAFLVLYHKGLCPTVKIPLYLVLLLFIITSAFDFTLLKHNHFATFFMFYIFFLALNSKITITR